MALTLTVAYLTVAVATTVIVFVASARLGDEPQPTPRRLALSAAAGLVWPVMLLGLAELTSVAVYAKVHEHDAEDERVDVLV
jgi:heme/copper-type cytochrome/quinol oxidase subunit 2